MSLAGVVFRGDFVNIASADSCPVDFVTKISCGVGAIVVDWGIIDGDG